MDLRKSVANPVRVLTVSGKKFPQSSAIDRGGTDSPVMRTNAR